MAFHNHAAQLFQVAVDIFNFIRQLLDFGFEQVEQQFIGVTVDQRLVAHAHTVQAESGQFALAQREQATFADGKRHGRVAGVIFGIFKKKNEWMCNPSSSSKKRAEASISSSSGRVAVF